MLRGENEYFHTEILIGNGGSASKYEAISVHVHQLRGINTETITKYFIHINMTLFCKQHF